MMYRSRTQKLLNTLPALTAFGMLAASNGATAAATLVFNYANGFAGANAAIQTASSAAFSGSVIEVTSGATGIHEAGAAWYKTAQNIQSFTTDFTFQPNASGYGFTFCIQNSNATTNPLAYGSAASADSNVLGYGAFDLAGQYPIKNSIAVKFDLTGDGQYNYPAGGQPNSTGLYINGGPAAGLIPEDDMNPSGINMHTGNVMAAHIVYDGSLLTLTLRDTVTNAQFKKSWPVNIPAVIGGNLAYIGFTSGTIPAVAQNVLTWSFSSGFATKLAAPTFSVAAGLYPSAQSVSINAPSGAAIYYTTNGQQPTTSSNNYTGPISVTSSQVVQAVAIESGYTDSSVAMANYQIAAAGTPIINLSSGFSGASGLVTVNGSAKLIGSVVRLTDAANNGEAGAAWYAAPVNVQSFTTTFNLQLTNPNANGMTFCIQNQNPASSDTGTLWVGGGPNAVGNNQSALGYSGLTSGSGGALSGFLNSVAVKFDLYNGSGNSTGMYVNAADPSLSSLDMGSSGLSLHSGNPLSVTLTYNGTTLAMTITDTKTKASYSHSWTIDIPSTVGGSTAYVGFTGGTGGLTAVQDVSSWTYAASSAQAAAVPAPPTNLRVQ